MQVLTRDNDAIDPSGLDGARRYRIAVVEDEEALVEILEYNLRRAGYQTDSYTRGDTAWEGLRRSPPDLILLDLMLPGMDGLELARRLKRDESTRAIPILMVTAKTDEVDRIVGLELGADDYISKPFSTRELVLRIRAVLRRAEVGSAALPAPRWLEAGDLRMDPEGHQVFLGDEEILLTPTEFRLLQFLLERRGRTQTRAQLLSDIWGYAEDVDSRTVDTHVRRLRKKLGRAGERVETVVGVGYRFRRQ